MNTEAVGLSLIGRVFRRRWRLFAVLAVAGALLGACASLLLSPGYETSAGVLLQGPRAADELRTEAQVAASSVVLDRAAAGLGWDVTGVELAESVTATVADGNIIEIAAVADSPERAQRLADRVAQEYVVFSTQLLGDTEAATAKVSRDQQDSLRQQVSDTMRKITELHTSAGRGDTIDSVGVRTGLESLRTALTQAVARLEELDAVAGQAKMVVMAPAQRPAGPAAPTMVHLSGGGAVAALVLGVFGHLFARRVDRRLDDEDQIVAALGSASLGAVDVPADPSDRTPQAGARHRLIGLLTGPGDLLPWHLPDPPPPADEAALDIRYRRALSRLHAQAPAVRSVLALVPADDPAANRAAARLAGIAPPGPVTVRVVQVSAGRPTVPDRSGAQTAVLVVVSTATRTAWELVGIAQACADAGQELLGVVVANRTGRRPPIQPPPEVPVAGVLAGSA